MPRAKRNYSRELSEREKQAAAEQAAAWKWFPSPEFQESHLKLIDWPDPDFPAGALIECGNLARLHFRAPRAGNRHPRRRRDTTITFTRRVAKKSYLTFDPEQSDRLYCLVDNEALPALAQRFWHENTTSPTKGLSEWAMLAGGRQARGSYPRVAARAVGVCTAVVYFAHKKDDGPSFYIHRMGEVTGHFPILCCDQRGRLWICGGNYTCPTPGITD